MFMKQFLLAPGPTPLPEEVRVEGARDITYHRSPAGKKMVVQCMEDLKYLLGTKNDVFLLGSSGSGAMECCMQNLVSPGDKVIVLNAGNFGNRWAKLAKAWGATVVEIKKDWGDVVQPAELETTLKANPETTVVFCQLSETSTGVCSKTKEYAAIVNKTNAILCVDVVSGAGVVPFEMDEWGIEACAGGSQKGMMLPPGLGFVSFGPKAWALVEKCTNRRFYFDMREYKKKIPDKETPWTPPITIICQSARAFEMIKKAGGREKLWERYSMLAKGVRAGVTSLGLKLFAKEPGDAVTAVWVPEGIDGAALTKMMRDEYGVLVGGGQSDYKGKIFRFGHMGYMDIYDEIAALVALEICLAKLGYKFEMGTSIAAFMKACQW